MKFRLTLLVHVFGNSIESEEESHETEYIWIMNCQASTVTN